MEGDEVMSMAFKDWVIEKQEEQEMVQAWSEYRAHGGKLDFTAWQEKQERETA
jgi:hypothetical protein